jgi:hypothetical protein
MIMRNGLSVLVVALLGITMISGCGGLGSVFVSDDTTKEVLGNTSWSDPNGNVELVFDENAKLTDLTLNNLPDDVKQYFSEGIKVDGTPFKITIPNSPDFPSVIAGKSFTVTLENVETILEDGTLQMSFDGKVSVANLNLDIQAAVEEDSEGNPVITGLAGSLSADIPFVGNIPIFEGNEFAGDIPIKQVN